MLTEEQEKALLEDIEMLRQDRGVYLQVYFTGTISVLASGKRLWPDE